MSYIARKLNTITNHMTLFRCSLARPAANRRFAEISRRASRDRPGAILCEGLWDHPHHWLRVAMFRNALAPVFGGQLIGVCSESAPRATFKSMRGLGLYHEELLPQVVPSSCLKRARQLLNGVSTAKGILDIEIAPGYPTHYFYDGVLKRDLIGTIDGNSPHLCAHLARALSYMETYQRIIERHDIRAVVVSHPTTIRFSTLVWAALSRGIPVFVINYRNEHITIRRLSTISAIGNVPEDVPVPADRDGLTAAQRARLIEAGRTFMEGLHSGKKGEISVTGAYGGDQTRHHDGRTLARILGADPDKPNVVILSSCWPDFPNAFGRCYFADHVEWLELTHAAARGIDSCNWIFKPHPAEYMYGRKTTLKKLIDGRLSKNMYFWPEEASGADVRACSDCVVSALGSVGFEYPALGARSLVARQTAYTAWGFSNYAETESEYFDLLKRAPDLPLPTQTMQEDALIYIALRLTAPEVTQEDGYRYPWGRLSYRLWPRIPEFVAKNEVGIRREIDMMTRWLESENPSYNVFKGLNPELW